MRRSLRIMRIVGLALLCAGLLGAWSMQAWAYAPTRPKEPPPGQASSHPKPPKPPEPPKARPRPKPPKEPKVRPRPKPPKAYGRRKAPPPPPVTFAPPPVPPASFLPHAGSTYKSHVTGVRKASAGSTASTAARNAVRYRSLDAGTPKPALKLAHLAVSRAWISRSGPRVQRRTTFVFRLSRRTLVEFVFVRVAPDCRVVGRFRVSGRAGLNRVQFSGRIGRQVLRPGTYRVTARTLPAYRAKPLGVPLVIVARPNPLRSEIVVDRASNACTSAGEATQSLAGVHSGASAETPQKPGTSGRKLSLSLPRIGGVLAAQFHKSIDAVKAVPPFLFLVLALAIALLALAATPRKTSPSARLEVLLAYRRGLIAIAGTTMFLGVVVTYAVL